MFKKSLLAASLALVAMNASAATLTTTTGSVDLFGKEFIANEATGIAFSDMVSNLTAQYSVGDIVTLTLSGATIDVTNSAALATYTTDLTATPTMVLGLLSTTATSLTFRVTAAAGNHGDTEAAKFSRITFTGLKITTASAKVASGITAVFAATTSTGLAIDAAATNSIVAMKGVNQYSAKFAAAAGADKLNAEVKVGSLRTNFGTGVYTDDLKVTFTDYAPLAGEAVVAALVGAGPTITKTTLNGDFSFLDTSGDGKITSADKIFPAFAAVGTATGITVATDLQSVSFAGPAAFTASGLTITAGNAAGDTVIKDQKFTIDTEMSFTAKTGGVVKLLNSQSAGAWGLDGANEDIAFLPFGEDYAQSITVSNDGTVEGAITVTIFADGMSYSTTLVAIAAKKSVTNISAEVAAFAAASGVTGDAEINVIVNAPAASIAVKGLYYHKPTQDRVLTK